MNETLFQFIWQHSLYSAAGLTTTTGEAVTVIQPGRLNRDAGPDFLEARVRVGAMLLVGHVELHLKTSDWVRHGHQHDPAYQSLILHVVLDDDAPNPVPNMPVIVLGGRIPAGVTDRYSDLVQNARQLPCSGLHSGVKYIVKEQWLSSLLAERWEEKLGEWDELLRNATDDWRNLLYWRMAANFGFKVNAAPFLLLAQSLPLNLIAKHRENPMQIEALLFGQAGMLADTFEEEYPNELQKEYAYLRKKYKLTPLPMHLWKFLRMRPANFPTIRITQFAALLQQSVHLFSKIIETHTVRDIEPLLQVTASSYWDDHFRFGEVQKKQVPKSLGHDSVLNIIINTVAPVKFLYAARQGNYKTHDEALQLLETVQPEKNHIISVWEENGWHARNAAETQALIQLFNKYCAPKKCLECAIGLQLMKSANGS